jgi:hypothetical protein
MSAHFHIIMMELSISRSLFARRVVRYTLFVLILYFLLSGFVSKATAQEQAIISLVAPTAQLQTGQEYEIGIQVDNAPDFWTADFVINYDPAMIYVIGTKAGSPVHLGDMFTIDNSAVVENRVQSNLLTYVVSKVGETLPARGSGIVGTFRIYPLASGTTQLTFNRAILVGLTSYDANATNVDTLVVPSVPALLEVVISGNQVEAPSEVTATPEPSATPTSSVGISAGREQEATAVNITLTPRSTDSIAPAASSDSGSSLPLILAIVVMLIGGIGAIVVLLRLRRSNRK